MKWISATDLGRWGETIPARTELPGLVGDLIRGTASDIAAYRFPTGDKGQVRGFDGLLEAAGGSSFVPAGRSIWEFGATKSQAKKFADDIKKRTEQVDDAERANTTFVFVTPQTWDNPSLKLEDALKPYREKCGWKDILYVDGAQLETWLQEAPAVAATHARRTLRTKPQIGARSCEEFWVDFSSRFEVDLTEEVLLCEREDKQARLLDHLQGTSGVLKLTADSPDEVIAFAIAAIRTASPEVRLYLEARTLVVETEEAALQLSASENLCFLARDKARQNAGTLSRVGPTVIGLGHDQKRGNDDFLGNPSTHGMAKALETMEGISEEQAVVLARKAGRSVTILARTIPRGAPDIPPWVESGRVILPAMLAGGWQAVSEDDREVVASLTSDGDYGKLDEALRPIARTVDAPIDLIGSVWQMRAPVDAFVHLGHLVTETDLERLGRAATSLFGTLASDENSGSLSFSRDISQGHSDTLRNGVATTLLHIAVLADQANLSVAGVNPQKFVDNLIKSLPGLTADTRLISSIRDQLPILMEAAPDPLLDALEQLFEGENDVADLITEKEGLLTPHRPLTEILWALEMLAWDPKYLDRVSLLLARLAELDRSPGRLANRPINSLQTIFTAWLPSTNANLRQRLSALTTIVERHESVGWDLLVSLLPDTHSTTSLTSKPRYRDAGASESEVLTVGMVHETYGFLVDTVISLAGTDASRWSSLITEFPDFPPKDRMSFYDRLALVLMRMSDSDRETVWKRLREQVARHRSFSDAAWSLPKEELSRLDALISEYEPQDILQRNRWLFDDWFPDVPGAFDDREKRIAEGRKAAVLAIYEEGYDKLLNSVENVKLPHLLGSAVGQTLTIEILEKLAVDTLHLPDDGRSFTVALSGAAHERFGAEWEKRVQALYRSREWDNERFSTLHLGWPDQPETWDFVESLSEDLSTEYWRRKQPFRMRDLTDDAVDRAVEKYLQLGRPTAALTVVNERLPKTPSEIIFKVLDDLPKELTEKRPLDQLVGYMVEQALESLAGREDVELAEVAKREFLYLELLRFRKEPLALHRLMADDPGFYFSVIASVFKAKSDDKSVTPSTEERNRAKSGFTLLSEFHSVPGAEGDTISYEKLRDWVDEVKALAKANDRVGITDDYIGRILAHSPSDEDDGLWPHKAVRRIIEEERSKTLEEGFAVEKYNSRGVFMKGVFEGGNQEREIAGSFRDLGRQISEPRTSALLHRMADHYERFAEQEDLRAEQDKAARD